MPTTQTPIDNGRPATTVVGLGYGALALKKANAGFVGTDRAVPPRARHEMLANGVKLHLPVGAVLTDAEARRLAWAILADLAPDEVVPSPEVVTYKEAQRLAVLRCVAAGHERIDDVARALGWGRRTAERRLHELVGDGRLVRAGASLQAIRFVISQGGGA